MATTTRYAWATPNQSDEPDVPTDMAQLANAVEQTVGAIDDRLTTLTGLQQSIFQYTTLYRGSTIKFEIPSGSWTPIPFDLAQYNKPDTSPGFGLATPTIIKCQQTGLYRITGFAGFAQNSTGSRALGFRVNGNVSYPAISSTNAVTDMPTYLCVFVEARVNKGDVMELVARQTSGAKLAIDWVYPRFSMQRVI